MDNIIQLFHSKEECFLGKHIDNEIIQQAEVELQIKFATDYYQYLLNIGLVAYDGHELTGICASPRLNVIDVTKSQKRKNQLIPADFYVIEMTNIDGIVIWQKSTGEIFETIYDGVPVQICNSLSEYIEHF